MGQDAGRAPLIETVARTILDAECDFAEDDFLEDNVHIPMLRRVVEASVRAARRLGLSDDEVAELGEKLRQHAEDRYMERWMSVVAPDEDPEVVRKEGLDIFRHVWAGGRR